MHDELMVNPNIMFYDVVRDLTSFESTSQTNIVDKLDLHWWGKYLLTCSDGEFPTTLNSEQCGWPTVTVKYIVTFL